MNNYVDIEDPKQTLIGPGGIKLHLDADEMYPNDPGLGTPMLFEFAGETMTWCCGYEGGNLNEIVPADLIDDVNRWTEAIADDVSEWETHWWQVALEKSP